MPKSKSVKDQRVYIDEDFNSADVSESLVGRKGYSLFKLRDMDVPVPRFFSISASTFTEFISSAVGIDSMNSSSVEELHENLTEAQFSTALKNEFLTAYSRLSGFTDAWVAVRSSVVLPQGKENITFAGMLGTVLNAKGIDDVTEAIKNVYASAFTEKVFNYLTSQGLKISDIKISIVVQKMIQAESSGIVFTIDPISLDENYLTIEAVFGLGDAIADGKLTPDQYVLSKDKLEYREKKIIPQEWMMIRKVQHKKGKSGEQKVRISKSWQHQQKIENKYIEELAKLAILIEKRIGKPQDIEWVFESGKLWILQTQDLVPVSMPEAVDTDTLKIDESVIDSALKIAQMHKQKEDIKKKIQTEKSLKAAVAGSTPPPDQQKNEPSSTKTQPKPTTKPKPEFVSKPLDRQLIRSKTNGQSEANISPESGEKLIITGVGASPGLTRGNVVIIREAEDLVKKKKEINKTSILVFENEVQEAEKIIPKVAGIISNTGGITNDVAILSREHRKPAIMGTQVSSRMLIEGEKILMDGQVGAIYGVRHSQTSAKGTKSTSPPKESTKKAAETKSDDKEVAQEPEKKALTATKIYTNLSDAYSRGDAWVETIKLSDGIVVLQIEDIYKKIGRHPAAYIEDKKTKEFIKQVTNEISKICEKINGEPIIITIGSMNVSQYRKLVKGKSFESYDEDSEVNDKTLGLPLLLKKPKEISLFLKIIKKLRNKAGWRNVSIGVEHCTTPDNYIEFKKLVTAAGLRRSSTFGINVILSSPSESLISAEFVKAGIDGFVFNSTEIASLMMAPSAEDDSVLKLIETIKTDLDDEKLIVKLPKDTDKIIKNLVKLGIFGISVEHSDLSRVRKAIAGIERDLIFGK